MRKEYQLQYNQKGIRKPACKLNQPPPPPIIGGAQFPRFEGSEVQPRTKRHQRGYAIKLTADRRCHAADFLLPEAPDDQNLIFCIIRARGSPELQAPTGVQNIDFARPVNINRRVVCGQLGVISFFHLAIIMCSYNTSSSLVCQA